MRALENAEPEAAPDALPRSSWHGRARAFLTSSPRRGLALLEAAARGARHRLWPLAKRAAPWGFFLVLPFLMFWWTIPFYGKKSLANDYVIYPIHAQLDMMWSVRQGTFPSYMPGFAAGASTAAMTLGQLFHPVTWISSWMPGYWKGYALEWNTLYRFLWMGLAHGLAFRLCRRLELGRIVSFIATFAMIYNLRMLDSMRYGASLEGFTGMILVATAAGFVYLTPGSKLRIAFLGLATYSVIVSGHPQWAYLGMLGATIFAAAFPWVACAIRPALPGNTLRGVLLYVRDLAIGMTSGVAGSMVYVLPFALEYFNTNRTRAENPYKWTLLYSDTLRGEISNFFFPLHADVHGAFGGSALFIVAALFPLALLARVKIPKILWLLWALCVVTFAFAAGKSFLGGHVHHLMVTYLPAFGAFRGPGRIVMWIPVLALPIWAWLLRDDNRRALLIVVASALLLLAICWFLDLKGFRKVERWTPHKIHGEAMPAGIDGQVFALISGTLALFALGSAFPKLFRWVAPLAVAGVVWSSYRCLEWGTWTADREPSWTEQQIARWRESSPNSMANPGKGMELRTVTEYRKQDVDTARTLGTIVHDAAKSPGEPEVYRLLKENDETRIYLDRVPPVLSSERVGDVDTVKMVYNTSNRFIFAAHAAQEGYFVFGQPFVRGWTARVDGIETPIELANVMFPTIALPRGAHVVELRFVSQPFLAGVVIAFGVIAGWLVASLRARLTTPLRRGLLAAFIVASAIGGGVLLQEVLLFGPSFETRFSWQRRLPTTTLEPRAPNVE